MVPDLGLNSDASMPPLPVTASGLLFQTKCDFEPQSQFCSVISEIYAKKQNFPVMNMLKCNYKCCVS